MKEGMDVQINGEPVEGRSTEDLDMIEAGMEPLVQSFLNVYRNKRNPQGYLFTVEEGEETHSVRITTENMKNLMKHIIDTF